MLSSRCFKTALIFLIAGMFLGMYMGPAGDFRLKHVHAHINLLGWVTLGMIGLLYAARPDLEKGKLPHIHFWLHTVGLLIFMGGFTYGVLSGKFRGIPVAAGASLVLIGMIVFTVHVFRRMGVPPAPAVDASNPLKRT